MGINHKYQPGGEGVGGGGSGGGGGGGGGATSEGDVSSARRKGFADRGKKRLLIF